MYEELEKMFYGLIQKLMKQDILDQNKSAVKLMKLDLNGNKCHKKEVKIGIAKSLLMDKLKVSQKFSLRVTGFL